MSRFGCGAAMTRIVLSPHQWRERLGMGARRISACWAHFSFRAKVKETLAGDSGGANLDLIAALAFSDVSAACRRISHQPSARFPGSALPASSLGRCSRSASRCCHGIASSENVGRELLGFRQVHVLKCELSRCQSPRAQPLVPAPASVARNGARRARLRRCVGNRC